MKLILQSIFLILVSLVGSPVVDVAALGAAVFGIVVIAVAGALGMRWMQNRFWPTTDEEPQREEVVKLQGKLIAAALLIALTFAFFPTDSFIDDTVETPWYIVPRADTVSAP